jgi:hypothetical protein
MEKFTHYHQLRVSDNNTIDLLRFNGKLQFKKNNGTYGSVAAETGKEHGALDNYVKRKLEKL